MYPARNPLDAVRRGDGFVARDTPDLYVIVPVFALSLLAARARGRGG